MLQSSQLLETACNSWRALAPFRQRRNSLKNYTFGQQWDELIHAPDGSAISERQQMELRGSTPMSINMIRRLVRLLVGRFRREQARNKTYDTHPDSTDARNNLPEMDARAFEEFIISGCAVQRVVAEHRPDGAGVWVDNVDPRRFFVNKFYDPRGSDINLIGMFHDMTWPEFANRFASTSAARFASLKNIFDRRSSEFAENDIIGIGTLSDYTDMPPLPHDKIRIIELWTLNATPNATQRYKFNLAWQCRFLTLDGTILLDFPSPFPHRSHPFVVKLYPLLDGEIHSFIEDLVDRQRSINRLLTSFDATVASCAKGALVFPADQLIKGFTFRDIGDLWSRHDSVIPISGRGASMPQQMVLNSSDTGIVPIIDMQLKLLEEASGISPALLGRTLSGQVGSEMYSSIIDNAESSIADLIDSFRAFIDARNAKINASTAAQT